MRNVFAVIGLFGIVLVNGCGIDQGMQNAVTQVASNADKAQTAEIQFLQSVQSDECRYDRLNSLAEASMAGGINVLAPCSSPDMTNERFKIRTEVMRVIVTYAQAMAALQGVSTTQFDADVKSTAGQFSSAAKAGGFLAGFSSQLGAGAAANAALGQLMDWIYNYYRKESLVSMARANQKWLDQVIDILKQENDLEAKNASNLAIDASLTVKNVLANPAATQRLLNKLQLLQVFWGGGVSASGSQTMAVQYPSASAANDALDQLRACHDLVAAGGTLAGSKCNLQPVLPKTSS